MAAPYRIRQLPAPVAGPDRVRSYFERLMKMIPMEVVTLYLAGMTMIPEKETVVQIIWAVLGLGGVFLARFFGTRESERNKPVDWVVLVLSCVAYLIWVYSLGGPFKTLGIFLPYVGGLLVLLWTFIVPFCYWGQNE